MGFDYEQFGDRVRALRKERDITQAELASVLNVESHYISRIERGLSGCSMKNWSGSSTSLKKSGWILFEGLRLEKV